MTPHLSSHRARWSGLCCLDVYNGVPLTRGSEIKLWKITKLKLNSHSRYGTPQCDPPGSSNYTMLNDFKK